MRLLTLVGIGCALCGTPAAARAAARPAIAFLAGPEPLAADTAVRLRFDIPSRPLADALDAFSRQTGVRVQVEAAAAAGARSRALAGTFTSAQALRELLAGTGLAARFTDAGTARVMRADAGATVYALTPVTVLGARSRGYATPRTSTATRTDTPLRDTPQSVSVVSRELIADQAMQGMADVVRYVPGITMGQGEGHRDAPTIRGNSSTADFFVDGVRDDAQYLRDLYNVERVEALKGSNAMVFGRGGGGGVLNRVSKEAQWAPARTVTAEGGSFGHKRATLDAGQGLGAAVAARMNGMYESSGGFRDRAELTRYGINPTLALAFGAGTTVRAGYEHFADRRRVDRGIPSFQGGPSPAEITTFFGNPDENRSRVAVDAATLLVEHVSAAGLTVRSRARIARYDKFYQNSLPGAVSSDGTLVSLSAYDQTIGRRNLFDQTDLIYKAATGPLRHTLLLGGEVGRQRSDVVRETGYFNDTAATFQAPFARPTVATPITFRQSATDANARTVADVTGAYVQDQVALGEHVQAIGGVRWDRFALRYHNNRTGADLDRTDRLVSPRAGLIVKPVAPVSIYGAWSISYLPSSGDQFGSLTATAETLRPERFTNREVGAKWDVKPDLALTTAVYRLDRTNTSAPDPADASRIVQTGAQRTTGFELGAAGSVTPAWQISAGLASQRSRIVSTTSAAKAGATVPLVPHQTVSLWNRVQVLPALGVGLGVVRQSDLFAAIDNTVTLPGFTRADGAVFVRLGAGLTAQVNVENLFDKRYYATSQGNNNIMPGASRTLRLTLAARR
ncbi:MAG: TonB-dependent siderophore receptor [Gemmatimonadetes bacterium]|nr:TonB-dependent siderophore receptor [Gemmatimonadota bacterium]